MEAVVQRVRKASVWDMDTNKLLGDISKGYFVLVGIEQSDSFETAQKIAEKLSKLRLMSDENNKMNLSLSDVGGEVLVVSQFTLLADTKKGNRPSFVNAAKPEVAEEIYGAFVGFIQKTGHKVQTGKFGANMKINAELDGPVTILM